MSQNDRGFDFLRVSLEGRLQLPAVITVTSAKEDDGASLVASGLAAAFASAGRATLLLGAQSAASTRRVNLTRASIDSLTAEFGGRTELGAELARLRQTYAIAIVDADPLTESSVAFEFASLSDGVLVAVKLGRKPGPEDRRTIELLTACGADVLGVVPTKGVGTSPAPAQSPAAPAAEDLAQRRARSLEASR